MTFQPIHFLNWIEANRHRLKPPVNNQVIWQDQDLICMVVGGPNQRLDYHVNQGQEFFYQLEGTLQLKLYQDQQFQTVAIQPGEIFLLSNAIPHSPQRPENSIGLVIETKRPPGMLDGFQWYCEPCGIKLYEIFQPLVDIVEQMPGIFRSFYDDPKHCHCPQCGHHYQPPLTT